MFGLDDALIGGAIAGLGSLASGIIGGKSAGDANSLSKSALKHGISWKVADAKAAGIHPLYALGAPSVSLPAMSKGDYGVGQMGQDIARGFLNRLTPEQKEVNRLQREKLEAETDYIKARTANIGKVDLGGQGDATDYENMINKREIVDFVRPKVKLQSKPGIEAGVGGQKKYYVGPDQYAHPSNAQEYKEGIEDLFVDETRHNINEVRNELRKIIGSFRGNNSDLAFIRQFRPPSPPRSSGYEWRFDHTKGLFKLVKFDRKKEPLGKFFLKESAIRKNLQKMRWKIGRKIGSNPSHYIWRN